MIPQKFGPGMFWNHSVSFPATIGFRAAAVVVAGAPALIDFGGRGHSWPCHLRAPATYSGAMNLHSGDIENITRGTERDFRRRRRRRSPRYDARPPWVIARHFLRHPYRLESKQISRLLKVGFELDYAHRLINVCLNRFTIIQRVKLARFFLTHIELKSNLFLFET